MPKFSDQWVIDRTLFEFVNGGQCGCCGRGFFLPDGVEGMISAISDLETDAANAEIKANESSPWPTEMREQVWSDRVRLRHKMKKEMNHYKNFWDEHGTDFAQWCRSGIDPKSLRKLLQMPRSEINDSLSTQYGIHSAFGEVLKAVTEQVAKFRDTAYPADGRGLSEVPFEEILVYDRRAGFTIRIKDKEGNLKEDILKIWLERMKSLGGPKLLERTPKISTPDEEGGADDAEEDEEISNAKPSFRSDRRIVRLLVARYWADALIQKYTNSLKAEAVGEVTTEEVTTAEVPAEVPAEAPAVSDA